MNFVKNGAVESLIYYRFYLKFYLSLLRFTSNLCKSQYKRCPQNIWSPYECCVTRTCEIRTLRRGVIKFLAIIYAFIVVFA